MKRVATAIFLTGTFPTAAFFAVWSLGLVIQDIRAGALQNTPETGYGFLIAGLLAIPIIVTLLADYIAFRSVRRHYREKKYSGFELTVVILGALLVLYGVYRLDPSFWAN